MMREAAGRLTGYALGEDGDDEVRSFARTCCSSSATTPSCGPRRSPTRLAESIPAAYADITPEAVRSQLAGLGVTIQEGPRARQRAPLAGFERTAVGGRGGDSRCVAGQASDVFRVAEHATDLRFPLSRNTAERCPAALTCDVPAVSARTRGWPPRYPHGVRR